MNRKFYNLPFHQKRIDQTFNNHFPNIQPLRLRSFLVIPPSLQQTVYKCRIVYSRKLERIIFQPYHQKIVRSLQLVEDNHINYNYKLVDRKVLEQLLSKRKKADDILIVKNGLITDCSYSNVVFFDGAQWITPSTPLLEGTKRAQLLSQGKIKEAKISKEDLPLFKGVKLINAMLDLDDTQMIPIENLYF